MNVSVLHGQGCKASNLHLQTFAYLADLGATLEETYKQAAVITHTARAKGLKLNARAEVNSSRRSQTADSA